MIKKILALMMAVLMLASTAVYAATLEVPSAGGTEVVRCIQDSGGNNAGIKEIEGVWFGSDNSALGIHYVNPETGKTSARVLTGKGSMEVTTNIPEVGKYEVYYFVSGHGADASQVKATINHKDGSEEMEFALNDASKKGFFKLGEFDFDMGNTKAIFESEGVGFLRFSAIRYVNKAGTKGLVINGALDVAVTKPTPPDPIENPYKDKFEDLKGHWAKDTIERMTAAGIVKGTSDTTYDPESNVTRAEFTTLMVRAMGYEEIPYEGQFEDVSADAWYAKNVASIAKTGIIVGYDGKFNPYNNITHEEAVKICVAAYELKFGPMDPGALATIFDDYFEISDWAKPYINKGVMISVSQGFAEPLQFLPLQKTTRAEAAVMINNLKNAVAVSRKFDAVK